jgi:hypothetical protein
MNIFVIALIAIIFSAHQGCDQREVSPSVRGNVQASYAANIKEALLSGIDPAHSSPSDNDLNYAHERLPEEVKLEIVTDAYLEVMEYPAFWDKTHPKDSAEDSEWELYMKMSEEAKRKRAEEAAKNFLGLMRH